jgi:hypothetical protein
MGKGEDSTENNYNNPANINDAVNDNYTIHKFNKDYDISRDGSTKI